MPINLSMPEQQELKPRISVVGVGGAGGNAINNMIEKELAGAEFVAANTDSQALQQSEAAKRIQLGAAVTQGLGAGANPEIGASAAEESLPEIIDVLGGSHMAFITAGMGGGTGTGAAPVIARASREMGILTVGVVTKPFSFEGARRMRLAESGIAELQRYVDTLIIIPNQNLFRIANESTTLADAFVLADDVLYQGVKGVTDLMVSPGLINLDFADVRAVMNEMGKAMMGSGESEGEGRALDAAEKAIANPLLDEVSLKGARGVLINITGGPDLTLFDVDEAANRIRKEADDEAEVFFGSSLDPDMAGKIRVSVVATGIDAESFRDRTPSRPPKVEAAPAPRVAREVEPFAPASSPAAKTAAPEPVAQTTNAVAPPAAQTPQTPPQAATPIRAESSPATALAPEPAPAVSPLAAPAPAQSGNLFARASAAAALAPAHEPAPQPRVRTPAAKFVDPIADEELSSQDLAALTAADGVMGRSFGDADEFESPRGLRDPAVAPAEPLRLQESGRDFGASQRDLVQKMTRNGVHYDAALSEPVRAQEDLRVQIPSFLRRQAN